MAQAVKHLDTQLIDELNKLLNLDYEAVKAYEAAIDRLHENSQRRRLENFKDDHSRHVQSLASLISEYGGQPLGQSESRSVLSQGSVVIRNIVGDQMVLKAMNCNERLTNELYAEALETLADYPEVVEVLKANLRDEQHHRDWLEQVLKAT